jgi:hypothetical protein
MDDAILSICDSDSSEEGAAVSNCCFLLALCPRLVQTARGLGVTSLTTLSEISKVRSWKRHLRHIPLIAKHSLTASTVVQAGSGWIWCRPPLAHISPRRSLRLAHYLRLTSKLQVRRIELGQPFCL